MSVCVCVCVRVLPAAHQPGTTSEMEGRVRYILMVGEKRSIVCVAPSLALPSPSLSLLHVAPLQHRHSLSPGHGDAGMGRGKLCYNINADNSASLLVSDEASLISANYGAMVLMAVWRMQGRMFVMFISKVSCPCVGFWVQSVFLRGLLVTCPGWRS